MLLTWSAAPRQGSQLSAGISGGISSSSSELSSSSGARGMLLSSLPALRLKSFFFFRDLFFIALIWPF